MKGTIKMDGKLVIERGSGVKYVACPFRPNTFCGDWCALFREPEPGAAGVRLELCFAILEFEELADERR